MLENPGNLAVKFGQRLKYLRQIKKMTQSELGEKIGLSRRQVSRVENGESNPHFSILEKLCQTLDTNIIQLFLFQEKSGSTQEKMPARADAADDISNNSLIQPSLIGLWSISNTTGEMTWTQGIYEFLEYSWYSVKPTLIRFLKRVDVRDKELLMDFFDTIHSSSHPQKILIRLTTRKSAERIALILKESSRPGENIQMAVLDVTEVQEMHHQLMLNTDHLEEAVKLKNIELGRTVAELNHELSVRRHAEQSLKESEEAFRTLAEKCPVSIFRFDSQGKVNFVNDWHMAKFNYNKLDKDFYLNRSVHELPGLVNAGISHEVEKMFRGETYKVNEVFFSEFAAGGSGWVNIRAVPIYKSGEIAGGILIRQNITERKNLEKALMDRTRLLEAFLDNTPDIMSVKRPDLTLVRYNKSGYEMLKKDREQVIGKKCYHLIGRQEPCSQCVCLEALSRRKTVSREKFIPELNAWFCCRANPVISDNGQVEYVVEIISDITKRKIMEDSLRKSEERFSLAMEAARDGLWDWDVQTDNVYYSPGYARMLGYQTNEFPGHVKSWLDLIHPEDREKALRANTDCINNRVKSFTAEFRMQAKNGDWKWILGRGQAVSRDASGLALRMIGTHTDITERKQTEKKLKFQNALLKTQMQVSQDGILILDDNFKIISFNRQFTEIWGIPESIMSLQSGEMALEHVLHKLTDPDKFVKQIYTLHNNKKKKSYEEITLTDGKTLERYSSPMFGPDDEYYGRIWYYRDITERKQAMEKIRTINEQLQKVNAEKDRLLSIIAHDLKSPLSGILSTSEILAEEAESLSLREINYISAAMHKSSQNALELLNDLMQWARVSQEGMDFSPEACRLYELAGTSLDTVLDMAAQKDITIQSDIPADLTVMVDQAMINTVLRNVIGNAVKFTHCGGNILLTARKTGSFLEVCIRDNGIGMSEKIMSSAFSVDKDKRRSGTDGEKGTGMGLILCREFVERHGGQIWVESKPGKGTKVFFILPAQPE